MVRATTAILHDYLVIFHFHRETFIIAVAQIVSNKIKEKARIDIFVSDHPFHFIGKRGKGPVVFRTFVISRAEGGSLSNAKKCNGVQFMQKSKKCINGIVGGEASQLH